jgi:hypothetical protein
MKVAANVNGNLPPDMPQVAHEREDRGWSSLRGVRGFAGFFRSVSRTGAAAQRSDEVEVWEFRSLSWRPGF